jgi:hypothetical protein
MGTNGSYTYTPNANFNGTDVFTYQVCDVDGDCSTATVTITITAVDDAPIAVNDVNTTTEDAAVSGSVAGNDTPSGDGGNTWSLIGVNGGAANGTVTMGTNGSYTYTPNANFNGTDVFTYQVCDVDGDCSTATVTITVIPACNISVTAIVSSVTCPGGSNGSINVTVNGANGVVSYLWNDGVTTEDRSGLPAGSYTITITDATPSNCTRTVTYVIGTMPDVTNPVITCPANKVLTLGTNCTVILPDYRSLVTVSDNCTAANNLVITQSPAAGTVLTGSGNTTVTFTVTDASGNHATCSFVVTRADQTAPVIACMPNKTIACDAALTFDMPTATDNCGQATITVVSNTSTDNGSAIVYVRTWMATDAAGNTSTCSQTVTQYRCNAGIFHTPATCTDFKNGGNGHQLNQLCYATRSNKISNVTPGQFFYYTSITAPSASFCVDVEQTKTVSGFGFFTIQSNTQIYLWDANCVKAATGAQVTVGQGRVCITNAIPGVKYVLSVKYDSKSVIGSAFTGAAPTATYTFQSKINGVLVAGSSTSINLVPNCTMPNAARTSGIVQAPVESQAAETDLVVSLTPNPTPENFRLFVTSASNEVITVRVFDVNGRKVKELKTATHQSMSFGNDLKQGLYFIEVSQGKKKIVVRAMKM